jgi:hypothetical protein
MHKGRTGRIARIIIYIVTRARQLALARDAKKRPAINSGIHIYVAEAMLHMNCARFHTFGSRLRWKRSRNIGKSRKYGGLTIDRRLERAEEGPRNFHEARGGTLDSIWE